MGGVAWAGEGGGWESAVGLRGWGEGGDVCIYNVTYEREKTRKKKIFFALFRMIAFSSDVGWVYLRILIPCCIPWAGAEWLQIS